MKNKRKRSKRTNIGLTGTVHRLILYREQLHRFGRDTERFLRATSSNVSSLLELAAADAGSAVSSHREEAFMEPVAADARTAELNVPSR